MLDGEGGERSINAFQRGRHGRFSAFDLERTDSLLVMPDGFGGSR